MTGPLFCGTLPLAAGPTPLLIHLVHPTGSAPAQYSLQPLDRVHHRKGAATGSLFKKRVTGGQLIQSIKWLAQRRN